MLTTFVIGLSQSRKVDLKQEETSRADIGGDVTLKQSGRGKMENRGIKEKTKWKKFIKRQ